MGSNQSKVTGTAGGGPVLSAVDAEIKAHEGHAKGKKVGDFAFELFECGTCADGSNIIAPKAGQPDKIESRERDWGSFERTVSAGLPTTIAVKVTGLKSKRYYEAGQSKAGQDPSASEQKEEKK